MCKKITMLWLVLIAFTSACSLQTSNTQEVAAATDPQEHMHDDHSDHSAMNESLNAEDGYPEDAPFFFSERPAVGSFFTCPVSGGIFEVESHTHMTEYEGRIYAFCCGGCAQDFEDDPAHYVDRLNET